MSALYYTEIDDSPVGPLLLAGDRDALHVLSFGVGSRPRAIDPAWSRDPGGVLKSVCKELDEYFAGDRVEFDLQWSGVEPASRYLGAISHTTPFGLYGLTIVNIVTP